MNDNDKNNFSENDHLHAYRSILNFFTNSPLRLFLLIIGVVFVGETTVMIILAQMTISSKWLEAIFDSTMLIVLLFPALYILIYKPFLQHIEYLKKAENKVRKSQSRFKQIFDESPLGIATYETNGNLLKYNKSFSKIFRIVSKNEEKCLQLFNFPNISSDIRDRINKGEVVRFENTFDCDNNDIIKCIIPEDPVTLNLDFIISTLDKTNPDSISGFLLQVQDVTEKKILERQLIQSDKLASLGFLISGVAHEINNPINFISFNMPILREYINEIIPMLDYYEKDNPNIEICNMSYNEFKNDTIKLIDNIEHGSNRINLIVSNLKEFVRDENKIELKDVDLNDVIFKSISICRNKIENMVQSFKIDIPDKIPLIKTDPRIIEQILVNLLINALQAVDREDSWVKIKVGVRGSLPGLVNIEISDNGRGIDDKIKNKIFDPFFTTKSPDKGTGLGLSICHNLAEQIGARIEVKSKPNYGSTFSLILDK